MQEVGEIRVEDEEGDHLIWAFIHFSWVQNAILLLFIMRYEIWINLLPPRITIATIWWIASENHNKTVLPLCFYPGRERYLNKVQAYLFIRILKYILEPLQAKGKPKG